MISLEKTVNWLVSRSRFITALISIFCFHQLSRLDTLGEHTDVSEDTIIPGGTPSYISRVLTLDHSSKVGTLLKDLGLEVIEHGMVTSTYIPATRGDGREGLVYVFVVDEEPTLSPVSGADVGLSIAASLLREAWLSKNVYFVFIHGTSDRYYEYLEHWFDGWYRDLQGRLHPIPLIRAACVFDFARSSTNGTPLLISEGINGQSTFEDYSNSLFEVARELNYHVEPVSVYRSIHDSMTTERVHRLHHVFLNFGIPAFTFARSRAESHSPNDRVTLQATAEVLGKHIRAVSGISHQLHHSSPFFLYTGPQKDVPMGVYLPLSLGLISPLFVSVIDRFSVRCSISTELILLTYSFLASLIVGLPAFVLTLRSTVDAATGHQESVERDIWSLHPNPDHMVKIGSILALAHIITGAVIKKYLFSRQQDDKRMY